MDNIGDIFYLILLIVISVAGAFSKKKEKKNKQKRTVNKTNVPKVETLSGSEIDDVEKNKESEQEKLWPEETEKNTSHKPESEVWLGGLKDLFGEVQNTMKEQKDKTESDVLMEQMKKKLQEEEEERKEMEREELREVAEKLNQPKEETEVHKKVEEKKKETEHVEKMRACEDGEHNVEFDLDLSDSKQARKAFIASEIFNRRY